MNPNTNTLLLQGLQGGTDADLLRGNRPPGTSSAVRVLQLAPGESGGMFEGSSPGTSFPVAMLTVQVLTLPGGGLVGPVGIRLDRQATEKDNFVLTDAQVYQFFAGKQYLNPVITNYGVTFVQITITFNEAY